MVASMVDSMAEQLVVSKVEMKADWKVAKMAEQMVVG